MAEIKYLIAVPTMDTIPTAFAAALIGLRRVGLSKVAFMSNSLVYDARNKLAKEAIETGVDRVLWLDSDMTFRADLMERMAADMDEGRDYVSGIFFTRRFPMVPCVYKEIKIDKHGKGIATPFTKYPKDKLFKTDGTGFGAVMTSTKLIKAIGDKYGGPFFPIPGVFGEDISFCWRAAQLGYDLYCDSRIKVGHIGQFQYGEDQWIAQEQIQNE